MLNGGLIPPGGLDCFGSGFLPATFQGSVFKPAMPGVANASAPRSPAELQQRKLALMRKLDGAMVEQIGHVDAVESAIANYELGYQMQAAVPELMDLPAKPKRPKHSMAFDDAVSRRLASSPPNASWPGGLIERGVRFVELTCPAGSGDRWDQHGNLREGHTQKLQGRRSAYRWPDQGPEEPRAAR